MNEKTQKRLNALLATFDGGAVQPEELAKVVKDLLDVLAQTRDALTSRIEGVDGAANTNYQSALEALIAKEKRLETLIKELSSTTSSKLSSLSDSGTAHVSREISRLEKKIPKRTDLSGLIAEIEGIRASLPNFTALLTQEGMAIRDGLELLPDGQKLTQDAIENLPQDLAKLDQKIEEVVLSAGHKGGMNVLNLTVNGTYAGTTRHLVISGSGVTYSDVNGQPTLIISSGVAGSVSTINPTSGAVDGSNQAFVWAQAPTYVIADGISYFDGKGYTLAGLTTTFSTDIIPTQYVVGLV